MRKEQLTAFIDRVIAQGETIRTHAAAKTSSESPATNWYPRVISVFHLLGSRADPWKSAVAKCPTDPSSGMTDKLLGALKAIREAVDQGLLADIEDAAHEEAFIALLEQARQLASDGLYVAAGTVVRRCCRSICKSGVPEWHAYLREAGRLKI